MVVDLASSQSARQPTAISCGFPQGSVLGPLLFSLFINDIADALKHTNHLIFADDTQIYLNCHPANINEALANIAVDAKAIALYASNNGLSLNLAKSKIQILGSSPYVKEIYSSNLPPIIIDGTRIPYVSEAINLGVVFSSDLSWRGHIAHVSRKVNYSLYKLKYHRNSLSQTLKIKVISTLIFPLFDYCCLVYHDLTGELNSRLQVLMNNCIRFIFDLRRDVHITP